MKLQPYLILAAAITLAAFAGRAYHLDRRPMHTDEAVHAIKFGNLLEHNRYRYDPTEYHGPSLYYLALPIALLRGETTLAQLDETTLRLTPLIASLLFFLPLFALRGIIGNRALLGATIATALSPIITYYSRYFIHETLLTGFMFAFITAAWLYFRQPGFLRAITAGIMLGLALATKETVVLALAASAVATLLTVTTEPDLRHRIQTIYNHPRYIFVGLLTAAILAALLYSSFFTNPTGPLDFIRSYTHTLSRAAGQGHEKPCFYYARLLFFHHPHPGLTASEAWFIIPATILGIMAFARKIKNDTLRTFAKFVFTYAVTLFIIYSCLPYKMPWLALSWMQPITMLAGIGVAMLLSARLKPVIKFIAIAFILMGILNLLHQTRLENGRLKCDERNPYVYSHTSTDLLRLPAMLNNIATATPKTHALPITVISDEYWPLPWYLRDFHNVGYWHNLAQATAFHAPDPLHAQIIITSIPVAEKLYPQIKNNYTPGIFGLRPGLLLETFVRNDIWQAYLNKQKQDQ